MTRAKAMELKKTFTNEFSLIHQLCEHILANSQSTTLLATTLQTLLKFLSWIPVGFIFKTNMIDFLVGKFLPVEMFRNFSIQCLTEIVSIPSDQISGEQIQKLFFLFMGQVEKIFGANTDLATAFPKFSNKEQSFVNHLNLFFTSLFKNHLSSLELNEQLYPKIIVAHHYISSITCVPELEIFKATLEYWNFLVSCFSFQYLFS